MDCMEKLRLFNLYVSLKSNNASLVNEMFNEASEVADHYPEVTWLSCVLPPGDVSIPGSTSKTSLFSKLWNHLSDDRSTAFLVNAVPHHRHITVSTSWAKEEYIQMSVALLICPCMEQFQDTAALITRFSYSPPFAHHSGTSSLSKHASRKMQHGPCQRHRWQRRAHIFIWY